MNEWVVIVSGSEDEPEENIQVHGPVDKARADELAEMAIHQEDVRQVVVTKLIPDAQT